MTAPRLICRDGVSVGPVFVGPRYLSAAGDIRDQTQPHARITLADAETGIGLYRAAIADEPNERIVRRYAEWCLQLLDAADACRTQRRERGWRNPYDADDRRGARA